jgi:two-component system, OmpR family, sensor kinase
MRTRPVRHSRLQTASRLGALRWRLTALLLVLNVIGLAGMGAVALTVDAKQREELVTAELRRTASTAVALLAYDSGVLTVDKLFADPTAQGSTAVYVYEGGRVDVSLVFAHPVGPSVIPPPALDGPARTVWHTGAQVSGAIRDSSGYQVPMLAVPFRHAVTAGVAGAVLVVADPRPGQAAHARLAVTMVAGGLIFMLMAGIGGHLLTRRGTRPAAEALEQQERFVADAAHEMRTPLTVIRALSEAALQDPGRQPETLREVLRATERLSDSVDALLTRARLVAGFRELRREPFRLDQLAEEVVGETVQAPHPTTISVVPTVVEGDPALIRIAIRNLASNAIRHGRTDASTAAVRLVVADRAVIITDNGPGMPDWSRARAGLAGQQRFQTQSSDGTGTGLGLAITRWVVELHGGTLRLEPAAGGGTVAILTLPETASPRPRRRPGR